jgi:hypothetical protein
MPCFIAINLNAVTVLGDSIGVGIGSVNKGYKVYAKVGITSSNCLKKYKKNVLDDLVSETKENKYIISLGSNIPKDKNLKKDLKELRE